MKKRYCDFCNEEIKPKVSHIKLTKVDYRESSETKNGIKRNHQIYPQKTIGDMCLKCLDKLKNLKK